MTWTTDVGRVVSSLEETIDDGMDATRAFLASPAGRRFRGYLATGLVVAAPLILRHPFFRTPLGRAVQVAGAVALLPKLADRIREWDPSTTVVAPAHAVTQS